MNKEDKNRGITLIALVITIVILLILAGVVIATLTGDNGIISQATNAKEKTEKGELKETVKLALTEWYQELQLGEKTVEDFKEFLYERGIIATGNNIEGYKLSIQEKNYIYPIRLKNDGSTLLPEQYQEVEYLESTGTQYIALPKSEVIFELDFENTKNGYCNILGRYWEGIWGSYCGYFENQEKGYFSSFGPNINWSPFTLDAPNKRRVVKMDSTGKCYCDGMLKVTLSSGPTENNRRVALFAQFNGAGEAIKAYASAKVYSLKLFATDDITLILNFIPCYRKEDNVLGMYDTVQNMFYTNNGSGEFLKGPIIE